MKLIESKVDYENNGGTMHVLFVDAVLASERRIYSLPLIGELLSVFFFDL